MNKTYIKDILNEKNISVSFEIFPPKVDSGFDTVMNAALEMARHNPDFISVTYGAGGGTSKNTVDIATKIQNAMGITSLAHLTCASSTKNEIMDITKKLKQNNIQNILALRGDIVPSTVFPNGQQYKYAYELVRDIKTQGDFSIGCACYPEGHVECDTKENDIDNLKIKVDAGCDFLITQIFFDNNMLYNFLYRLGTKNIKVPVIAGIMPVTNAKQIKKMCVLSGATLTTKFRAIAEKFWNDEEALKQAGIAYATDQIIDLIANGIGGIHIYTMNKPEIAEKIMKNISSIVRKG